MKKFLALLFVVLVSTARATTWFSDGSDTNIQSILNTVAVDGDTISIPPGTFTWNTGITVTKAVTIQGQTTVTGDHTTFTTSNKPVVQDLTTIVDNCTSNTRLINQSNNTATGTFRLTGLTFTSAVRIVTPSFMIQISGSSSKNRIDHVHSFHCNRPWTFGMFNAGGGVIDHFFCQPIGNTQEFDFRNRSGANGDEEFAA